MLSVFGHAQQPVLVKTLNVKIYAAEQYEASRMWLYELIDSTRSIITSVSETKTDKENQNITITLSASDKAFMIIDKNLNELGYVSSKTLKSEDKSSELDTSMILREIEFLEKQKLQNKELLETLTKGSELYVEVWKKISEIEEKIFAEEKLLENAFTGILRQNKIIITINY